MRTMYTIAALVLSCIPVAALVACDVDEGKDERTHLEDLEDDEFATPADDADDADDAVPSELDTLRMEIKPSAAYNDCPGWANFCFWTGTWYTGSMTAISGGDFSIVFQTPNGTPAPVNSMRKRDGTRRVKVFGSGCKVIGPEGGATLEPVLPFPVTWAKRIEPTSSGC